jgi:hypothetical protein
MKVHMKRCKPRVGASLCEDVAASIPSSQSLAVPK